VIRLISARIDSQALRANLLLLKQRAKGARILAVIKANAYGHGLVPVALALGGADGFAVARIEEAAALRAAGIVQPIVLLEGVINGGQLAEAARLQLEMVVHDQVQIALLEQFRGAHRFSLWLKVDTGMNRLGVRPEAFAASWARLLALRSPPLLVRVMTHLACADERGSGYTVEQLQRFAPLVQGLGAELSIANSAALLARPDSHMQWVRPGLALYGVSPFAGETGASLGLKPVMTLMSTVIAVREVPRGEHVGYGASWRALRATRLAILAGGYGDGLLRSLPSGSPIQLAGRSAPIVGRVSMDMIAVDVTDLPTVQPGDQAQLWGAQLPVEQLAAAAGTIPYELLCGVSQRVPIELV
jgi:alanine racemase